MYKQHQFFKAADDRRGQASFCPNCGQAVAATDEFCPNCGFKLHATTDQPSPSVKHRAVNNKFDAQGSTTTPTPYANLGLGSDCRYRCHSDWRLSVWTELLSAAQSARP
ncbi:zinc-ribbon domain-containing protein [Lactiplantibacillus plantarum]